MGTIFSGTLWRMADQRDEAVSKKAHCAWQIHYPIVFPVKYRRSLLDEAVTTIIRETAAEIAKRFPIEMEAIGTDQYHIHLLCSAHPKMAPAGLCRYSRALRRRDLRRKPAVPAGTTVVWRFCNGGVTKEPSGYTRSNISPITCQFAAKFGPALI